MRALVVVEHDHKTLKPASHATITAAQQLNCDVDVLVVGWNSQDVTKEACHLDGVKKIYLANDPQLAHFLAEPLAEAVLTIASNYTHLLAPATTFGKNFMPRIAASLDVMQISDLTKILSPDTFERPIYAGNALVTLQSKDPIKVLTIRPTAFFPAKNGKEVAPIIDLPLTLSPSRSHPIGFEASLSERPELTNARIIIAGGRGLHSKESFKLIENLADCLNAAIGASRAAVDAGFVSNDYQVGQTGKIVAPDLYIAIGISGAIQHVAGMKDSKIIVAINKDPSAPIFQIADYGLVGDLFEIVPQLINLLCKGKPA
jgi:electron transfer flavoprotein alpha subunit